MLSKVRTRVCPVGPEETCTYELHYITSPKDIPGVAAWLAQRPMIALDLETSGLQYATDNIITMQLGALGPEPRAYVIDMRLLSWEALEPIWALLRGRQVRKLGMNLGFEAKFLGHRGVLLRHVADIQLVELVCRAGLFSVKKGASAGNEDNLDRAAYGATSMAALAKRYLHIELDKDQDLRMSFGRSRPGQLSVAQLHYAADDVIVPFFIFREQQDEIRTRELGTILKIEFEVLPVLAQAELRGMRMDRDAWLALWQEAVQEKTDLERSLDARFRDMLGQGELFAEAGFRPLNPRTRKPLNYNSSEQVGQLIAQYCQYLKWPVEIVTTDERLTALKHEHGQEWLAWRRRSEPELTEDDIPDSVLPAGVLDLTSVEMDVLRLARLTGQLPRELVGDLVKYAVASHRATSFGKAFLDKNVGPDGRMRSTFHQALAATGRLSSEPNIQNIPNDQRYRRCFIPAPGYRFVICDYSQIEPRLSAQVSQDPVYVETFRLGLDIYLRVGETLLGHPIDPSTPEGAIQRQIFKTVVLALAYRMGAFKLWKSMMLALEDEILDGTIVAPSREEIKDLHRRFFEMHTGIADYQTRMERQADPATGPKLYDRYLDAPVTWVTAPCGRKRYFASDARGIYTQGPNAPIQGCSATITKLAAALVQQEIDAQGLDACVVNLVHDEIVWEVRDDQAVAFAVLAKRLMEEAAARFVPDVPVIAAYPEGTNGVVEAWIKKVKAA